MERLLTNLVENALRYGKPEFRIATRLINKRLRLSVIDHGLGIPVAELETIKRPFVRGNVARNEKIGAGLGLVIVERIAQLHSGTLQVFSKNEGGFEAEVEIPVENTSAQSHP